MNQNYFAFQLHYTLHFREFLLFYVRAFQWCQIFWLFGEEDMVKKQYHIDPSSICFQQQQPMY